MKCSDFLQELTNYLDGMIDDRTKAELEDHLAWCHNCYVVCDTTKKTIEIYRDSKLYELPEDLRTRLRAILEHGIPRFLRHASIREPQQRLSLRLQ